MSYQTTHTTEQTSFSAAETQQALSEKIQNTEKNLESYIKYEFDAVKESQASSFEQLGNQLHETRTEIKEVKENQEKTQGTVFIYVCQFETYVFYMNFIF